MFKVNDLVIKNEDTWVPTPVDTFGRGIGVGIVCEPLNPLPDDHVEIIWMGGGRCIEAVIQLKPAPVDKQIEMTRDEFYNLLDTLTYDTGFDFDRVQKAFAYEAAKQYHQYATRKTKPHDIPES